MSHEIIGLIALALSLLGTVIVTTWRSSAVTTGLQMMVQQLQKQISDQNERQKDVNKVPDHERRIEHLERNHSLIPKLESRVIVVEQAAKFSKELRQQRRGSRPEIGDDE